LNKEKEHNLIKGVIIVSIVFALSSFTNFLNYQEKNVFEHDYTLFLQDVAKGEIESVVIVEKKLGPRELHVKPKEGDLYIFNAPHDSNLVKHLVDGKVKIITKEEPTQGWFTQFFFSWGPTILFIIFLIWIMKKTSNVGGKNIFKFGQSNAQLIDPNKIDVSFNDVVGCDEAKREIQEFVDFLKNPEKFAKLGGRIPRGVLLTGPAGTGKTLLAKALAKESGVPFFAMSGSDFIEMFVGVGASRVRDMFEQAKKKAPCVLFIDEIDTIGSKRGLSIYGGGSHDEREQTLNQILVELDGMDTNKGIILVGATNRPEVLDPALLRPGRIDRQITVSLPDINGREEILKLHSRNVPLAIDVDLRKIARGTPGFSGAELANLINEATIFAARRNSKFVSQIDLEKAKDKILMGIERPSLVMSEEDKKLTAYHESGHAIIAKLLKNTDPVYKVTIIPRGHALGITQQLPEKDRHSYKKEYIVDKIAVLLGGRAAEEIFCNTLTTGASQDILAANSLARSMVMEWGMSKLGPIAFGEKQTGWVNSGINTSIISENTHQAIDTEVSEIIQKQSERVFELLKKHADKVESMVDALMEAETLNDWQIDNIMNGIHYNQVNSEQKEITEIPTIVDGSEISIDIRPAEEPFVPDKIEDSKAS